MPLGKGVRYRFKSLGGGKSQRLAFKGNKVIEVTPFKKGADSKLHKSGVSERIKKVAKSTFGKR